MKTILFLLVVLSPLPAIALDVRDDSAQPMSTGMGWDIRTPRPSDAEVVASSLGPIIKSLRGHDRISPDMLGDDSPEDDTELLRWALVASRILQVPLWINHEYRYSKVLEAQDKQTIEGNGPDTPGLKMLVKPFLESHDLRTYNAHAATLIQAPGAKRITIRNLQIDGAQYEVDWEAAQNAELSNVLRNSPGYSGLAFHNQSGRELPEKVILENVHVHDTAGSCMVSTEVEFHAENLTLGNSVSGRVLYRFRGVCTNLYTYGFTASSIARINAPSVIVGWKYRGLGQVNPWPQYAGLSMAHLEWRKGTEHQMITLQGLDWDAADADRMSGGISIGQNCVISGSIRNFGLPVYAAPGNQQAVHPWSADIDIRTENCQPPRLTFETNNMANVRNLRMHWVNRTTDKKRSDINWSGSGLASYRQWYNAAHSPLRISIGRQPYHAVDHEQRINLHIDDDWPHLTVLHIPDLHVWENGTTRLRTAAETIPTYLRLSGRIDNLMSVWIAGGRGITEQYQPTDAELQGLPLRITIDGLQCNKVAPGAWVGDHSHTIHGALLHKLDWSPLQTGVGGK